MLSEPIGVAADSAGNVFIADDYNSRIRAVSADGNIRTIAGTGTAGYNGDGISASTAELNSPTGIAISNGSLLIADYNNNRVRHMDAPSGILPVGGMSCSIFPVPSSGMFNCYFRQ